MRSQANPNHQERSESLNETSEEVTNDELRDIWLEICEKVTKADEDLRTWINGKADIYDSTFDRFLEERGRLKSEKRKIKKKVKVAYRDYSWKSTSPRSICDALVNSNFKPSFVVDNNFRDVDSTVEFLGQFGTLSYCRNINENTVKVTFYYMEDAVAALNHPKYPRGVSFYADPFPEFGVRLVRSKTSQRKRSRDQSPESSAKRFRSRSPAHRQSPVCVTITDEEEIPEVDLFNDDLEEEENRQNDYINMSEAEKEEYLRQNGIRTIPEAPEINLDSDEEETNEEEKEIPEVDLFSDDLEEEENSQNDYDSDEEEEKEIQRHNRQKT